MKKVKKHLIEQVPPDEAEMDDDVYDSMIENGTSEDDDDNGDDNNDDDNDVAYDSMIENGTSDESDNDDDDDDDGPSNKKQNLVKLNAKSKNNANEMKRKRNQETTADDVDKKLKKIKSIRNLNKPPTVEELNKLRETEHLYHSNLFRMQVDEVLKKVKVKEKYKNYIKEWLQKFNEFLKNDLKSMDDKAESANLKWQQKTKVKFPFSNINREKNSNEKAFRFQFLKPIHDAFLIGSFPCDTLFGTPTLIVDVCVLMPSKYFQKDDYLNLIYDKKRALYLQYLTWKIQENPLLSKTYFSEMKFNYFQNNPYKTILEVKPESESSKIGEKLSFRIFISPDDESFKLNRFVPWNSNIRGILFDEHYENPDDEPLLATPNYNATVLHDLTMKTNNEYLKEILPKHQNLRDGLILLKIWLKQRKLDVGFCGFSGFLMSMWVVYLFKMKKLHKAMSSYQIARNTWNHLAVSTWNENGKGISLFDGDMKPNQPTLEQFHAYYDVVFIDTTGFLNLCANLSLDLYFKLKFESQRAIEFLNNNNVNSFQLLFTTKVPILTSFDEILKITNKIAINETIVKYCKKSVKYNFAGAWYPIILNEITSVLRKGLSNRIISMVPIEIPSSSWNIEESPWEMRKQFYLGFVLDYQEAFEILNKGPQANNEVEAEEFRKLWGKKSKLRRFQDGSIVETCVWASSKEILSQKRNIVERIISYLLNHQFHIFYKSINYFGTELNSICELNKSFYLIDDENMKHEIIDAESTTLNVIRTFDELGKNLRDLNDLPLEITSIQGISSVFRYCDPIPTLNNSKTYLHDGNLLIFQSYKILDAVIQLGFSGKWPDELDAFTAIKTAFHIQIARELRNKYKYETRGAVEGVYILKDGYVFRIEVAHQREITLTKELLKDKGIVQYLDTPTSLSLEKRFNIIPKITSTLHGLYQRYTSFGPAVMIAKRWLYSQMIDPYLWPDECTELLMASLYLNLGIHQNPFQPQCGFIRFLNLLANTDWQNEMFILNFNDELSQDEITKIEDNFIDERDSYPPLTLITSYDKKFDGIWTKDAPTPQILAHVTILARHALNIIETKYLHTSIRIEDLFIPNLDGYDVIITLRSDLVHTCLAQYNFDPITKKDLNEEGIDSSVPAAGFDPAQIGLSELRGGYSEFAVFFYNPCGGKYICAIWKPHVFVEKEFKECNMNGCKLLENGNLIVNRERIVEDFKIILKDFYYDVEDRTSESYKQKLQKQKIELEKKKEEIELENKEEKTAKKVKANQSIMRITRRENLKKNLIKKKIEEEEDYVYIRINIFNDSAMEEK